MGSKCFVIQPFDNGKFDKRYEDVFVPAIQASGLEPYWVDHDPGVSIPINDIQSGIESSSVCLVDISTDNPNVWFELGYAIAAQRDVILVCSDERKTNFPFDVQHRSIIKFQLNLQETLKNLRLKFPLVFWQAYNVKKKWGKYHECNQYQKLKVLNSIILQHSFL